VKHPVRLSSDHLEASISPFGAELVGLVHRRHGELLWSGDPVWWDRQSPILFPVVGKCADDAIRVGGRSFAMPLHGFAHSMSFHVAETEASRCRLVLTDGPETRAHYPFPFRLEVDYRLDAAAVRIEARIANTGDGALPASFGFHPGFRWPLADGLPKTAHWLAFESDDRLDVARAREGLILPGASRLDLADGVLQLDEALFAQGAMVLHAPRSRRLRFGAAGSPFAISVAWRNLPSLGLWMRPGARFLCVEPWAGHGDPVGFGGDLHAKPGIVAIPPGDVATFGMDIAVEPTG
jgi:galactose mutarotase-like enzyme